MDDKKNGFHFPSIPKGKDYEDYIAAILASDGYYLERNIHCWIDKEELLELDIVSTKFSRTTVNRELIEIKSGDNWGYSDIFKVFGWMKYLGYKKGSFIVRKKAKLTDFTKEHCKNFFNIDLIINPESEVKNYLDDSELLAKFNIKTNLTLKNLDLPYYIESHLLWKQKCFFIYMSVQNHFLVAKKIMDIINLKTIIKKLIVLVFSVLMR